MRALQTARLDLEPQTESHAEAMYGVLSDPAIYRFENEPPSALDALQARFRKLESRTSPDGTQAWLNWVARHRASSRLIGYVQATVFRADAAALVAYEFGSDHWGHGYATEAVDALLAELAANYGVVVAGAVFKRANLRSRRLLLRLGMADAHAEFPAEMAGTDEDAMAKRLLSQ